jgi:hypothetical protein
MALVVAGCGSSPEQEREDTERDARVNARVAITGLLRDPDSAEFGNMQVHEFEGRTVVCGRVNSRNGFGGMTGPQRFVTDGGTATILEETAATPEDFDLVWATTC